MCTAGHAHGVAQFGGKNEDATLQALTGGTETSGACRIYPNQAKGLKV